MLTTINHLNDFKALQLDQLDDLATQIRQFLITSITQTGGHLAANLGTVELTIALHYVFDMPNDSIIWDVGHQAYTHKILTGRRDKMITLRQKDGLSGFTKRSESPYDVFGAGHSSTSISAALGIAIANQQKQNNQQSIAVIGDGALTGGMAFEALNNAGDSDANLLIVLNDNDMSISKNVGALNKYLTKLLSGRIYTTMKKGSMKMLDKLPTIQKFAKRSEEHLKGMILPGTLFEELGIDYFGPIDGHDVNNLITTLENLKQYQGVRLLHVVTKKGQGLPEAEQDPCKFHGISPHSNDKTVDNLPSYSAVFGKWLCQRAADTPRLIGITPAMCEGSGMQQFAKDYPDRYFDVGIAEQHAITFAGGLATQGFRPVVAIYSTFLQRGYDQVIHDIALQNLPVIFAIDRAGLVGADGATHAGIYDLTFLRCVPNLTIIAPSSANECYLALNTALAMTSPVAIRYPRGKSATQLTIKNSETLTMTARLVSQGETIAILSFGHHLTEMEKAAKKLGATLVDMRFVKPLDEKMLIKLSEKHRYFITLEDNSCYGGAGSAVLEFIAEKRLNVQCKVFAIADVVSAHGSQNQLYKDYQITSDAVIEYAKKHINHSSDKQ